MTNNDILRRIRYIFDYNDDKMIDIFAQANYEITRIDLCDLLQKDYETNYKDCSDLILASFLNGLINEKRGKRDGEQPIPEENLTNNSIFMKLKIALNLKAEDILEIMDLVEYPIRKHELTSFFRKPNHRNYTKCKGQVLRKFIKGLQLKYRPTP